MNRATSFRTLAVGIFILLVVVRIPAILTDGRFWAEEGVVYFHAAWHQSWLDALFTIHTGYLRVGPESSYRIAELSQHQAD
jgi:hypothetical protein